MWSTEGKMSVMIDGRKKVEGSGRLVGRGGRREPPHGRPLPRPGKATPRIPGAPTPLLCRSVFPASRCVAAARKHRKTYIQAQGKVLEATSLSAALRPEVLCGDAVAPDKPEPLLHMRTPP